MTLDTVPLPLPSAPPRDLSVHVPHPVVVFACGEGLRGDDSVAGLAVASLPPRTRSATDVRLVTMLEPEHLLDLAEGQRVVIVDAVVGIEPGEIVAIDLDELSRSSARLAAWSSHQLPIDRVVGLASFLRETPVSGRFVGLGIGSVVSEAPLSGPVRAALPDLSDAVAAAIEGLRET